MEEETNLFLFLHGKTMANLSYFKLLPCSTPVWLMALVLILPGVLSIVNQPEFNKMWKRDSPSASVRHSFVEWKFDNPKKKLAF